MKNKRHLSRIIVALCLMIVTAVIIFLRCDDPSILQKEATQSSLTETVQSIPESSAPAAYTPTATTKHGTYYDPVSFCHLPMDHFHNNSNIVYNNIFPKTLTIDQIKAKRVEPIENIPMCPNADIKNYNRYQHILSKLPNNLIAYTSRCQINAIGRGRRQFGGLLSGDPLFPNLSTQVGFLHVYKAGGTTVRDTMNNILPGLGRVIWHKYRPYIRAFMSHLFMFSHVRDPVTRVLSSFFELHRRNETDLVENDLVGVHSFRYMLAMMENRMDCALANKNKLHRMRDPTIGNIYFNMHIMPQMFFLTEAKNPWRPWPVNYVGNMTELDESMFEILYHFFWNTTDYMKWWNVKEKLSYESARQMFNKNYHHGRNRHHKRYINGGERKAKTKGDQVLQYQIELDDLSDDDIRQICEVYWMDYICIPFPVPKACNLTELLLRHYGEDVVYRDCWQYETKPWDQSFAFKYVNNNRHQKRPKNHKEGKQLKQLKMKAIHMKNSNRQTKMKGMKPHFPRIHIRK